MLTKSSIGVPQVTLVNKAISVLVHDGEGLKRNDRGAVAITKKNIQLKLMV